MSLLMTLCHTTVDSPVGPLHIEGDGESVTGLYLPDHKGWTGPVASSRVSDVAFRDVREQLAEYFAGERQEFNVPLRPEGTPFQRTVWQELERIPFGETITYAELARRIGNPSASRAVGAANGKNPISIIIPCHRVIGAAGALTGYGGGRATKEWLLEWERSCKGTAALLF